MTLVDALRTFLWSVAPASVGWSVDSPPNATDPDAYELRFTGADVDAREALQRRVDDFISGWRACRSAAAHDARNTITLRNIGPA